MAFPFLEAVIVPTGFMILKYIFETNLDLKRHSALKLPTLPKTLEGVISQEKFEKSRAYRLEKSNFHFVHELVTILMDSAILFFRVLPWFWKKSGDFVVLAGLIAENEILHTLSFLAGVMIWSKFTDLPFSLYSTFVIEARHGFNKDKGIGYWRFGCILSFPWRSILSGLQQVDTLSTILMNCPGKYAGNLFATMKSGHFVALVGLNAENEILHTLAFLAGLMIWSKITSLPFSLYSIFVIEARHGFNKRTIWLFFRDMFKGICLTVILAPPIVSAAILIVQKGGYYSVIYLWALVFILSLVMMTIYPILIAPLFNKFTPLPEGQLREKIEMLASSLEFPLKKLFVVDGSTRSSHSNAYMYGFYNNKRIVLYDTLIQQCKNDEEIVAVIAHELGHWKLNHVLYFFIANQIGALLCIGGYTLVRNWSSLFQSFGFHTRPLIIGLIIFLYTIIPIQHLVYFASNLVSRAFEFQADAFAKKLGYGSFIRASLVRLQEENLSAMNIDPWYSVYHYTHPRLSKGWLQLAKRTRKDAAHDGTKAG